MASFDVKLVSEFDGAGDALDWLDKVELLCGLQEPRANEALVIPLRLKGDDSAVYRQMTETDKKDAARVKQALRRAFAGDKYAAYEQFSARRLQAWESVDMP